MAVFASSLIVTAFDIFIFGQNFDSLDKFIETHTGLLAANRTFAVDG